MTRFLRLVLSRDTTLHKGGSITRSNKSMILHCGGAGVQRLKICSNTYRYYSLHKNSLFEKHCQKPQIKEHFEFCLPSSLLHGQKGARIAITGANLRGEG